MSVKEQDWSVPHSLSPDSTLGVSSMLIAGVTWEPNEPLVQSIRRPQAARQELGCG